MCEICRFLTLAVHGRHSGCLEQLVCNTHDFIISAIKCIWLNLANEIHWRWKFLSHKSRRRAQTQPIVHVSGRQFIPPESRKLELGQRDIQIGGAPHQRWNKRGAICSATRPRVVLNEFCFPRIIFLILILIKKFYLLWWCWWCWALILFLLRLIAFLDQGSWKPLLHTSPCLTPKRNWCHLSSKLRPTILSPITYFINSIF